MNINWFPSLEDISNNIYLNYSVNILEDISQSSMNIEELNFNRSNRNNISNRRLRQIFDNMTNIESYNESLNLILPHNNQDISNNLDELLTPFLTPSNYITSYFRDDRILENFINNTLSDESKYKNILSEEGKKELEIVEYKKNSIYNSECPIYQIDFEEGEKIIKLPCNHCFNQEAINKWLTEEQAICPICRYKLKSKEVKKETQNNENEEIHLINRNNLITNLTRSYAPTQLTNNPLTIITNLVERTEQLAEEQNVQEAILQSFRDINPMYY